MEQDKAKAPPEPIALTFDAEVGVGKLNFRTLMPGTATVAEIDAIVDTFEKVAARQAAKAAVLELKKHLQTQEDQLNNMRADRARIDEQLSAPQEGRRRTSGDEAKLKAHRENADTTEKKMVEIIGRIRGELAANQAIVDRKD